MGKYLSRRPDAVRELQQALARARHIGGTPYYAGPIDGILGPASEAAIIAFRADHDLSPTVEIDNTMLRLLGLGPALITEPGTLANTVAETGLRLALTILLNRLFPGKEFPMDSIVTTVKSAWASKLNWTMAIGVIFNIFMLFGHPVPDDVQAAVITAGNSIVLVAGWIIRTWFTTSVTTASAKLAGK